jgi:hypothetical protein
VYSVTGPSVAVGRALNLLIDVGVVVCVEILVSRMAGKRAGLLATCLVAVCPPLVVNDVTLLSDSLSLLLLPLALLALQSGRVFSAALLLGGVVVTRDSAQLLPVVLAVVVISQFGMRRAALLAALAYSVAVPWVVRNDIQLGAPVFNTSNGFNLAAVYSPQARAAGSFVDPHSNADFVAYRSLQRNELNWDSRLRALGLKGLRQDPFYLLQVVGRNTSGYFEFPPRQDPPAEIYDGRILKLRRWSLPLFYIVTILGVAGLAAHRRNPTAMLIAACATYFSVVSLLSEAPPRLRAPFDLACCIGVGLAATKLADRAHRRNRRPTHGHTSRATPEAQRCSPHISTPPQTTTSISPTRGPSLATAVTPNALLRPRPSDQNGNNGT